MRNKALAIGSDQGLWVDQEEKLFHDFLLVEEYLILLLLVIA